MKAHTEVIVDEGILVDVSLHDKIYHPLNGCFRPLAKVRYDAYNNELVLSKGSIIRLPKIYSVDLVSEESLDRYINIMQRLFIYFWNGELKDIGNHEFKVVGDIRDTDPTIFASMITGEITGGWSFFLGIDELTGSLSEACELPI